MSNIIDFYRRSFPRGVWFLRRGIWTTGEASPITLSVDSEHIGFVERISILGTANFSLGQAKIVVDGAEFTSPELLALCGDSLKIFPSDQLPAVFGNYNWGGEIVYKPPVKKDSSTSFTVSCTNANQITGSIAILLRGWLILTDESDTF